MARVRHSGTAPELTLRRALRGIGLRYLRRAQRLPGSPDLSFARLRLAVFVDGCFWHGCPRHGTMPKANRSFWAAKIRRNRQRDHEVDRALRRLGWRVVRVWEHELREDLRRVLSRIQKAGTAALRRGANSGVNGAVARGR